MLIVFYQQFREFGIQLRLFRHGLSWRKSLQVHHAVLVDHTVGDFWRFVLLPNSKEQNKNTNEPTFTKNGNKQTCQFKPSITRLDHQKVKWRINNRGDIVSMQPASQPASQPARLLDKLTPGVNRHSSHVQFILFFKERIKNKEKEHFPQQVAMKNEIYLPLDSAVYCSYLQ